MRIARRFYPPIEVSKEFYYDVKTNKRNYSDFMVGYIGYELSFGGKWFAGYVKRDDKSFVEIFTHIITA